MKGKKRKIIYFKVKNIILYAVKEKKKPYIY